MFNCRIVINVILTLLFCLCVSVCCDLINSDVKDVIYADVQQTMEARKKSSGSDLLSQILPNLAMPFIMQAIFLPMVLIGMMLTLTKSMLIGKLGVLLWIFNIFINRSKQPGGLYSHSINIRHREPYPETEVHGEHYEVEENKYGKYARKKRRKRR